MFDFKDDELPHNISKSKVMQGGAIALSGLADGVSSADIWDKLHEHGLNDEECEIVIKVVGKFVRHQNGNHSECGDFCKNGKINLDNKKDALKLISTFTMSCIKCGSDKIDVKGDGKEKILKWGKKCPDCGYDIHTSLMNRIEAHFRGKLPDDEVDMFKVGFDWCKIDEKD